MKSNERIIVALDVSDLSEADRLVSLLKSYVGFFKVGLRLIISQGAPKVVEAIKKAGGRIFLDGKFLDIPNTVAGAAEAAADLGVEMFNVHCWGSKKMMFDARVAARIGSTKPIILGVTLLTSLNYEDLVELGIMQELDISDPGELIKTRQELTENFVASLAFLAQQSGLDGVVASPQEIQAIRHCCESEFLIVTPGVRPAWAAANDQKRVMTPAEAIKAGADYLVIGRPIIEPPKEIGGPVAAVKKIIAEIESVSK